MKNKVIGLLTAAALCVTAASAYPQAQVSVHADEWYFAGETCEPLHDTSRDVQTEGVGNPLNFGERNTPADASAEEIRAINHKMSVQEVKYALYKEIDEHWDLISTRIGQTEREKVYALFLGLGSRESTLGENKIGADHETAYEDGWGVNSAHAYGTLQTAVTAFKDCDPTFMPEDNVPEMFQYSFTPQNFYDAIISNHMGIRKILHFAQICIDDEKMTGYQVIRNSLKGFNTGWCYMAEDDGAYKTYADEICSMAQFYYYEGHLYDNVFTWTSAGGDMEKYRTPDRWESWWGNGEPSMAPITTTTTTVTTSSAVTTTSATTTASETTTSAATTTSDVTSVTSTTTSAATSSVTTAPGTTAHKITTTRVDNITEYSCELSYKDSYYTSTDTEFDTAAVEKLIVNYKRIQRSYSMSSGSTDYVLSEGSIDITDKVNFGKKTPQSVYTPGSGPQYKIELYAADDISTPEGDTVIYEGNHIYNDHDYLTITVNIGIIGDANCDEDVNMADAVLIMQSIANPDKYKLSAQGEKNADVEGSSDGVTNKDALKIQKFKLNLIDKL